MVRTKNSVHQRGIEERIARIWKEERHHILALIPNVMYHDYSMVPNINGELDILKIYSFGKIGIEEVKTSRKGLDKAKKQLQRAEGVFKYYNPDLVAYLIREDKVIRYA